MPLACSRRHLGGSEPMHRARQFSQSFLGGIFEERTCTNEHGKTTSMIPLIIFVFGEFSSPVVVLSSMRVHVATLAFCELCKERQSPFQTASLFSRWFVQVCLGKPSPRKQAKVDVSVFFGGRSSNMQDSSKASPRTIFKGKSLKEQPKLLLKWQVEEAEYAEFNGPTCGFHFVSYEQKTNPFPDSIRYHYSTKVILAGLPIKAFPGNKQRQTSVLFRVCVGNAQGLVSLTHLHACEQPQVGAPGVLPLYPSKKTW